MKLFFNMASPFVRKVRVFARETGLDNKIEEIATAVSPVQENADLANANPLVKIPALVLDDGTSITGGSLTVGPFGTLAIETAGGATLNGVKVTNENSIEVFTGSVLKLDQVTTVDNSTGVVSIDGTGRLSLDEASISGGTVNNHGTKNVTGMTALTIEADNYYFEPTVLAGTPLQ